MKATLPKLFLFILLLTALGSRAFGSWNSTSEYNYHQAQANNESSIHNTHRVPEVPRFTGRDKPKYRLVLTRAQENILGHLKIYATQQVEQVIAELNYQKSCLNLNSSCKNSSRAFVQARLTQVAKINKIYRRLTGVFSLLKVRKQSINYNRPLHFLPNELIKKTQTKKLRLLNFEQIYVNYIIEKIHAQIEDEWLLLNKKYQKYLANKALPKNQRVKITYKVVKPEPILIYKSKIIHQLKSYYFNQITVLVSKEPLLVFHSENKVKEETLKSAYSKYTLFLQSQINTINDYNTFDDYLGLVSMYASLPEEKQSFRLLTGEKFTNKRSWEKLYEEVYRVASNKSKFSLNLTTTLAGASLYSNFAGTFPLFGTIITLSWIGKGFYDFIKSSKKLSQHNIYWLSGLETYKEIIETKRKINSTIIMSAFFGLSLQGTVARAFSSEKDLFTLKADEMESFLTNLIEYAKLRLKWSSKGKIANLENLEAELVDHYLLFKTDTIYSVPPVVLDYNDIKTILSGCLKSKSYSCSTYDEVI